MLSANRMAMMATTVRTSISVKPERAADVLCLMGHLRIGERGRLRSSELARPGRGSAASGRRQHPVRALAADRHAPTLAFLRARGRKQRNGIAPCLARAGERSHWGVKKGRN